MKKLAKSPKYIIPIYNYVLIEKNLPFTHPNIFNHDSNKYTHSQQHKFILTNVETAIMTEARSISLATRGNIIPEQGRYTGKFQAFTYARI
jgi:hypothetical protein